MEKIFTEKIVTFYYIVSFPLEDVKFFSNIDIFVEVEIIFVRNCPL